MTWQHLHTTKQVVEALDQLHIANDVDTARAAQVLRDNNFLVMSPSLLPEAVAHREGRNW